MRLLFIVCFIATTAIVDAGSWYKQNPTNRYGKLNSGKNEGDEFGVDQFEVNGGRPQSKSGGSLTRGDDNNDENERDREEIDEQGGNGYQGGRGNQGGRGSQDVYGNTGRGNAGSGSNKDAGRYPGGWSNQGGRGYQDNGDERRDEDSESEDDSRVYTRKSKHRCRGCRLNNIGNGVSNENQVFVYEE